MKKTIQSPELLVEFLEEAGDHSADFKALALRLYEQTGDLTQVSELTRVPQRTLYEWLAKWNTQKKPA
jgi:transposase-like protein